MSRILTKPALKRYLKQRDFKALAKHNIHPKIDGMGYIDYRSLPDWALALLRLPMPRNPQLPSTPPPITEYNPRQVRNLEFIGDSIVGSAARMLMIEECCARSQYVRHSILLVTNENLGTSRYKSGDASETAIGKAAIRIGLNSAFSLAKDILMDTLWWRKHQELGCLGFGQLKETLPPQLRNRKELNE